MGKWCSNSGRVVLKQRADGAWVPIFACCIQFLGQPCVEALAQAKAAGVKVFFLLWRVGRDSLEILERTESLREQTAFPEVIQYMVNNVESSV